MATARTRTLRLVDHAPKEMEPLEPSIVELPSDEIAPGVSFKDGVLKTEHSDGSVTIDLNPDLGANQEQDGDFYANLANKLEDIEPGKLASIASELIDGINRDEDSRREWLATRSKGIELLGLKIENPRSDLSTSGAPLEGMSSVRHPLLLEATVRFQATARGELLPASGPVKIRNDSTVPPLRSPPVTPQPTPGPPQGGPPGLPQMAGGPQGAGAQAATPAPPPIPPPVQGPLPMGVGQPGPMPPVPPPQMGGMGPPPPMPQMPPALPMEQSTEEDAEALEKDFNHYLTVTATEYVPDTDRMLFYIGFGGDGFKKVFNCPLRRRPVSESVDAEDLIISNASTDLRNCGRVTHRIKMRKSILRRMQILGAYRDVELKVPAPPPPDAVEKSKQSIAGQNPSMLKPEDQDYTIYEVYCELDLKPFAPKKFKNQGLALPYRVTLEKDSRQVLSIIRNWKEKDGECLPKQFFVQFPFIRGLGFYGLGFIHLLGNTCNALTAMWRECVDSGMFANFPGFIYNKAAGRQLTNQFRIPVGGGIPLDLGAMQSVRDAIMPVPYKDLGPAFTAFMARIEDMSQRLGQTAEIQVGEGKQDAPVGTTMALIEQATKMLDSVHKRMHAAQAEEFALLKERFQEDPEAFWRHNRKPALPWRKEQFLKALDNNELVPVADPNNPTSLHRIAKAAALQQLMQAYPLLLNPQAVLQRIMRIVGIDTEGLFRDQPAPPPPDPRMEAIKQKAQTAQGQQEAMKQDTMAKAQMALAQLRDKALDRESREKLEQMKIYLEGLKIQEEKIIHAKELQMEGVQAHQEMQLEGFRRSQEMQADQAQRIADMHMGAQEHMHDMEKSRREHEHDIVKSQRDHEQSLEHQRQMHQLKKDHMEELHAQKLEHERALAEVKKSVMRAKPKGKSNASS